MSGPLGVCGHYLSAGRSSCPLEQESNALSVCLSKEGVSSMKGAKREWPSSFSMSGGEGSPGQKLIVCSKEQLSYPTGLILLAASHKWSNSRQALLGNLWDVVCVRHTKDLLISIP